MQANMVVRQLQSMFMVPRSAGLLCHPVYVMVVFVVAATAVLFEPPARLQKSMTASRERKAK